MYLFNPSRRRRHLHCTVYTCTVYMLYVYVRGPDNINKTCKTHFFMLSLVITKIRTRGHMSLTIVVIAIYYSSEPYTPEKYMYIYI